MNTEDTKSKPAVANPNPASDKKAVKPDVKTINEARDKKSDTLKNQTTVTK